LAQEKVGLETELVREPELVAGLELPVFAFAL
jgi:hypothetical protein